MPGDAACRSGAGGDEPFGEAGRAAALFVDAGAPAGGDGSQAAPLSTIGGPSGRQRWRRHRRRRRELRRGPDRRGQVDRGSSAVARPCRGPSARWRSAGQARGQRQRVARLALPAMCYGAVLSGRTEVRLRSSGCTTSADAAWTSRHHSARPAPRSPTADRGQHEHGLYVAGALVSSSRAQRPRDGDRRSGRHRRRRGGLRREDGRARQLAIEGSVISDNEHTGLYAENAAVAPLAQRGRIAPPPSPTPGSSRAASRSVARRRSRDRSTSSSRCSRRFAGRAHPLGATATVRASSIVGGEGSHGRGIELEQLDGVPSSIELVSSAIVPSRTPAWWSVDRRRASRGSVVLAMGSRAWAPGRRRLRVRRRWPGIEPAIATAYRPEGWASPGGLAADGAVAVCAPTCRCPTAASGEAWRSTSTRPRRAELRVSVTSPSRTT